MKKYILIFVVVLFVITFLIIFCILKISRPLAPHPHPAYFRISDTLDYDAPSTMPAIQPFLDLKIQPSPSWAAANFVMLETLNHVDVIMSKIQFPAETRWIFGLGGSDLIASKSMFAMTLQRNTRTARLLPPTWIVERGTDAAKFAREYRPGKIYILKQNVQRQEGFLITDDRQKLQAAFQESGAAWVVAQELLQNPLTIQGADGVRRKINLRVYLLVVVGPGPGAKAEMYMYGDGFIYYTADPWTPGSLERGPNITTGYVDRQVYADNPLTIKDLYRHLGPERGPALASKIKAAMQDLAAVYRPIFRGNNAAYPGTKFLIYGCDVAPDAELGVTFMEVNKGPDLTYKDERDRDLKLGMVREACEIVGLLGDSYAGGFLKL